jgi:hypothetical protein
MASGAGGTVTYFGIGSGSSGATELDFFGTVTPNLVVSAGVTPQLTGATVITHSVDGMSSAAGTAFLALYFANTAWANLGNSGGLQPSTVAGSVFLSLHTASPGVGGTQATSEIAYA